MSDQLDKDQDQTEETPAHGADVPETETGETAPAADGSPESSPEPTEAADGAPVADVQPGVGTEEAPSTASDDTPDVVKAMAADALSGSVDGSETEIAMPDVSSIKEPSMDIPAAGVPVPDGLQAHPAEFPQLGDHAAAGATQNIDLLLDVKLPVSIELGRTTLRIFEILEWGAGAIVELDKLAGEPVNLMVNNKRVAVGEVVVVDEKFGLRITNLMSTKERLERL